MGHTQHTAVTVFCEAGQLDGVARPRDGLSLAVGFDPERLRVSSITTSCPVLSDRHAVSWGKMMSEAGGHARRTWPVTASISLPSR